WMLHVDMESPAASPYRPVPRQRPKVGFHADQGFIAAVARINVDDDESALDARGNGHIRGRSRIYRPPLLDLCGVHRGVMESPSRARVLAGTLAIELAARAATCICRVARKHRPTFSRVVLGQLDDHETLRF